METGDHPPSFPALHPGQCVYVVTMQTPLFLAAFGMGGSELLIILAIVLLLFGGTKLPEFAKGLGKSIKEFKKASQSDDDETPAKTVEAKKVESGKTSSGSN